MKTMNKEEQLMESVNYVNNLVSCIEASEEEQQVSIKLNEQGFKSLNKQEREVLKRYLTAVGEITYTAKFMKHVAVIAAMYDPTITARVKDVDWSIIEEPIKNRNDMSEFEIKKALKDMEVFGAIGKATNPTTETGFNENGRPYARNIIGDLDAILYLDTHEYELREA
jgi:hypothetical protein